MASYGYCLNFCWLLRPSAQPLPPCGGAAPAFPGAAAATTALHADTGASVSGVVLDSKDSDFKIFFTKKTHLICVIRRMICAVSRHLCITACFFYVESPAKHSNL